jgi:hypothetical protein
MNILEATTSGKPFRNEDYYGGLWLIIDEHQKLRWYDSPSECEYELMFRASDVLADNWEIKERELGVSIISFTIRGWWRFLLLPVSHLLIIRQVIFNQSFG